jgi:ubiquinone/menaquinone biosynthesis C-methylase UbiE
MAAANENTHSLSNPAYDNSFQELYLQVRTKEKRLFEDEIVKDLPYSNKIPGKYLQEWSIRARTSIQIKKYLSKVNFGTKVLDVGCGNGWFSAQLAQLNCLDVVGLDINMVELKQGSRIFSSPNLHFCFGSIFENIFMPETFDFIFLNASIQYFENLPLLFDRLFLFLKKSGEIHITDSPFYSNKEVIAAKLRSKNYYSSINLPRMASHYFPHTFQELSFTNYRILNKKTIIQKISDRVLNKHYLHFPWIKIMNAGSN